MVFKDIKLIERYLFGNLSPEEQACFDIRIQDPTFKEELEAQESLWELIQDSKEESNILEDELEDLQINQQVFGKIQSTSKAMPVHQRLSLAARAMVILTIGRWQSQQEEIEYPEALFAPYFVPFPNQIFPDNQRSTPQNDLEQAFRLYDQQNFREALSLFDQWHQMEPSVLITFYKANAFLALGEAEAALGLLEKLSNDFKWYLPALWYKALAYLKINRIEQVILLLEQIIESGPLAFPFQKADKLLETLREWH